jgi:hypothetical protein
LQAECRSQLPLQNPQLVVQGADSGTEAFLHAHESLPGPRSRKTLGIRKVPWP